MIGRVAFRLCSLVPVLVGVTLLTFVVSHFAPGDPVTVYMGTQNDPVERARLLHKFGLDLPLWRQYLRFLWDLLHGDLGQSYFYQDQSVRDILARGVPVSAELGVAALLTTLLIGIPAGTLAALRQNTWIDRGIVASMFSLYAVPSFVLIPALLAVDLTLYAHGLPWLPTEGWGGVEHLVLPVLVMAAAGGGYVARLTRTSVLEALRQDHVRTAYAKGLTTTRVVRRHVLRNALIPVVTFVGPSLAYLVTGAFIAEYFFNIPGIGFQVIQSISDRDFPVVQGIVVLLASTMVLMNLLTDLAYEYLDPRIRPSVS